MMNVKNMVNHLEEQKKLGYPNFKNKIVSSLVEEYGFEEKLAKNLVFHSIVTKRIEEDIIWSQHMGAEFWAEVVADMHKA